ncbi:MAG: hypothetical protein AAFR96_06335 [Planctomycetota bacterium]
MNALKVSLVIAGVCSVTPASGQLILVDLGTDATFRGASVTNPDSNGNSWNSLDSFAFNTNLIDSSGSGTGVNLGFSRLDATDSFNGPLTDDNGFGDPALPGLGAGLGPLAVGEAAFDYFVNPRFDVFNLDPNSQYEVTLYGGRKFGTGNTSNYLILSDNSASPVQLASLDLDHANAGNFIANTDSVVSAIVTPGGGGTLTIDVSGGADGGSGYLNAFSLRLIPTPGTAAVLGFAGLAGAIRRR